MPQLLDRIRRSLARDNELPLTARVQKGVRFLSALVSAPYRLRHTTQRGARSRTMGRPVVQNAGTLLIGNDVILNSQFAPCTLTTLGSGRVVIGDRAAINFGTTISAAAHVVLGSDVSIGPYGLLVDHESTGDAAPRGIDVGDGVWLAGRVTLLPGTRIGAGSVVTAGSVVNGEIPAGVVAGGNPARVLRTINAPNAHATGVTSAAATPSGPAASASTASTTTLSPHSPTPNTIPPRWRGVVLADFTIGDLAVRLRDSSNGPGLEVVETPFAQVVPVLIAGPSRDAADFAVVWTRPEVAIPAFQQLLDHIPPTAELLLADVDAYCDLLLRGAAQWRTLFAITWTRPFATRGLGMLDTRPSGVTWALNLMNQRLMERCATSDRVHVLDAQRWVDATGQPPSVAKGWYAGKIPFTRDVFREAALDIAAAMRATAGESRKLLVLDLDDTLWGGIVGDQGWENLRLGGHDAEGEAHVDFQRAVKRLSARGVLLAIASKNTESVALEAIESHPEMLLRRSDFVAWRINWKDKAANIAEIAAELNLGLQSVVFIDDNPVERARVREALPEVLVPDWPADKLRYASAFAALRCFDVASISAEDTQRRAMYAVEHERSSARESVGSVADWIGSLGIRVTAEPLSARTLTRVTQLLNKTNQMNLTTRRLTEAELSAWAAGPHRELWSFSVSDKFGDSGLTGILGLEHTSGVTHITDFILSCRVMGRAVEETITHLATVRARAQNTRQIVAPFIATSKNAPCLEYWERSGFEKSTANGTIQFTWDADSSFPAPTAVTLTVAAADVPR